jgi:leucyl-tRNA synthetase
MDNKDKDVKETKELVKIRNKMIYDITTRLEQFSLNTVVSGFMEYNNKLIELTKNGGVDRETLKALTLLIAPFAPHIGEEMWQQLGGTDSVFHQEWPSYDESKMKDDEITIPVQVNGKTRATVTVAADASKEEILEAAKKAVTDKISGTIRKEIYVPGKIVNIVAK